MGRKKKKLGLKKETLRKLDAGQLEEAAGGTKVAGDVQVIGGLTKFQAPVPTRTCGCEPTNGCFGLPGGGGFDKGTLY